MTPSLRKLLLRITPNAFRKLRSSRIAKDMAKQREVERALHSLTGGRVLGGPFQGLNYCDESCGSMLGPKLLGVYELEIQEVVKNILNGGYKRVIDIGAAEGYYAVGLLRACRAVSVVAFESSPDGRRAMKRMADENGVSDRLTILGECGISDLREVVKKGTSQIIIADVEGGEKALLDPAEIPDLLSTDILVEVHDFIDSGISSVLLTRFSPTHQITRFRSRKPSIRNLPEIPQFTKRDLLLLASERRPCVMEWFWMRARGLQSESTEKPYSSR